MSRQDLLEYEIRSSWWAWLVPTYFLQGLAGHYFAWKVNGKYERWQRSLEGQRQLEAARRKLNLMRQKSV